MNKKRLLIIGLDGFTWQIANKLCVSGIMPTFNNLCKTGTYGKLQSVMPFETSAAWTSFQTGCQPNKSGIFSFHVYDKNNQKIQLNSYNNISVPTLWEILDTNGKTTISINMPVTSPPPKIRGIIIPGLLCPGLSENTIHPSEIYNRFIKPSKEYTIVNNNHCKTVQEFVMQSCKTELARHKVAVELMKEKWDLFCFQMQSTDLFQHRFWWTLDSEANGFTEQAFNKAASFYNTCDNIIKDIIQKAGPNTTTIILSDHGFTTQKANFSINRWLRNEGFLTLLEKKKSKWEQTKDHYPVLRFFAKGAGKIIQKYHSLQQYFLENTNTAFSEIELRHLRESIDFEKSQAFCLGAMAGLVYINEQCTEKEKISNKIKHGLLGEFGPSTNKKIIKSIKTGSEVYQESLPTDVLPDLVVEYEKGVTNVINPNSKVFEFFHTTANQRGTHAREGVYIINGENIRAGYECDAHITDILPTTLACMGLPIPNHLDGKTIIEAFKKPPTLEFSEYMNVQRDKTLYNNNTQSEVEKRLSDLGYL